MTEDYAPEEFLINALAAELEGVGHIAVGALSPVPGSAALLARELAREKAQEAGTGAANAGPGQGQKEKEDIRVSIIHGDANNPFTDGGRELFD